jgi:hypothetical protein
MKKLGLSALSRAVTLSDGIDTHRVPAAAQAPCFRPFGKMVYATLVASLAVLSVLILFLPPKFSGSSTPGHIIR